MVDTVTKPPQFYQKPYISPQKKKEKKKKGSEMHFPYSIYGEQLKILIALGQ